MKIIKIMAVALVTALFIACNFTEEIHFEENGSGKLSIRLDGSEMMQMMPESDSTLTEEKIDSTLVFKDLLREKKDSIALLSPEEQAELKRLEPFSIHMLMNPEKGVMNFDMFTDFKDVSEVNDAFSAFQNASAMGPNNGTSQMGNGPSGQGTEVTYSFKGNKFSRIINITDQELFQQSIDSLASAEMFLASSTYTFKYHFPKRVKSTNLDNATFSMDGKTLIYEVNFLEMSKAPESVVIEVELEK
ncbi:hypothetical protein D1013_04865 [Euzebyella marina]|uniref:Lipoprotein n=1 Tax=Euzebyella marina TaxID=1761453 RepID=A0A3G2L3G5_9FLAO|nr:hypothetical protein [Euzebyella marina]AYN66758.1 hypothetical protein D1013_04865 [Euzebyella marina]